MNTEKTEILLIELSGASIKNKLSLRHSIYRSAPIGLYCLKALDRERISVIDVPVSQIIDNLSLYKSSSIKAIICRLSEDPEITEAKSIISHIRNVFPEAKFGCNFIESDLKNEFDFIVKGTGKTALLNILSNQSLSSFCDQLSEDLKSNIEIPKEPLINVGYYMLPEKWLSDHDLEVWQPWLGLLEFSTNLFTYPGLDWMNKLLVWLTDSGFDSFHFTPSNWTVEEINSLRQVFNKLKINLSISFPAASPIDYSNILLPIKRIWLYEPQAIDAEEIIKKLKEIKSSGFEACMQISHSWFANGSTLNLCKYIDHLVIRDDYLWKNIEYKKFMQRFWGSRNRFFKQLFGLRTASELISFLKSAYAFLEILFLPDNKGDK